MLKYQLYTLDFFASLLILVLVLRMIIRLAGGAQAIITPILLLTDWLVRPLVRIFRPWRGLETAALPAALIVAFGQIIIELLLRGITFWKQPGITLPTIGVRALLQVTEIILQTATVVIFIAVLASWLRLQGPLVAAATGLAFWMLAPIRRLIRPIGGIDFSPLIAMFLLLLAGQACRDAIALLRNFL